ncbi:hypothetical protein FACS18948_1800 [Clostridia bacterium]|nr:hypothetical protein FACS18948_1800 [Clostridia bacterium]
MLSNTTQPNANCTSYHGFPTDMPNYFFELSLNNNAEWFNANRDRLNRCAIGPMTELVSYLAPTMLEIDGEIDVRPKKVIARMRRDARHSQGKPPYRDHCLCLFRKFGTQAGEVASYWFVVSAHAAEWGCGFYNLSKPVGDVLRTWCVDKTDMMLDAIGTIGSNEFAKRFEFGGESYKRANIPDGLPDVLRPFFEKKNLSIESRDTSLANAFDPAFADTLAADFRLLAPIYRIMAEARIVANQP